MPSSRGSPGSEDRAPGPEKAWSMRRMIPLVLLINTGIALVLWLASRWSFGSTLVHAHAIGFSILGLHYLGHRFLLRQGPDWLITAISLPLGSALGLATGAVYDGRSPLEVFAGEGRHSGLAAMASSAVFGLLVTAYFSSRARLAKGEARLREEQLHRESAARALAEAELKLLQAQIEPHFLFNTLSNVVQLVDEDPPRARRMLMNLTSYLRGSLRRTRAGATTLGEELDLVRAYLEIQAVRMGERLRFTLRCPEALRERPLPPLLLQPIVENALRHGLEPKPGGGEVVVSVERDGEALVLEVTDDGMGLDPHRPPGVGLTNVRERVRAISGGLGTVTLRPGGSGGLCVRIVLPSGAGAAIPGAGGPSLRDGAATPATSGGAR